MIDVVGSFPEPLEHDGEPFAEAAADAPVGEADGVTVAADALEAEQLTGAVDDIFLRCLVVESQAGRVVFLSLDLIGLFRDFTDALASRLAPQVSSWAISVTITVSRRNAAAANEFSSGPRGVPWSIARTSRSILGAAPMFRQSWRWS